MSDFHWSDAAHAKVRVLWAEVHSTAEIGRRIGVSKNAIIGKAHRLNLPPRPNPMGARREDRAGHGATPRKVSPPRLKPPRLDALVKLSAAPLPVLLADMPPPAPLAAAAPCGSRPPGFFAGAEAKCGYVLDNRDRWRVRRCDAPRAAHSRSYCAEHHTLCHQKRKAADPADQLAAAQFDRVA